RAVFEDRGAGKNCSLDHGQRAGAWCNVAEAAGGRRGDRGRTGYNAGRGIRIVDVRVAIAGVVVTGVVVAVVAGIVVARVGVIVAGVFDANIGIGLLVVILGRIVSAADREHK